MSLTEEVEEETTQLPSKQSKQSKQKEAVVLELPHTPPKTLKPLAQSEQPQGSQIGNPLEGEIAKFKNDTLVWAKAKLDADKGVLELETKEVKDLVSMVDTIEKSYKPKEKDDVVVVNVLVQNLMEAKDDC